MSASAKKRGKVKESGTGTRARAGAPASKRPARRAGAAGERRAPWFGLGLLNAVVLVLGLVAITFGYVLLDGGSVTAAPLLLVLGYVVLLPLGLLLGYRKLDE